MFPAEQHFGELLERYSKLGVKTSSVCPVAAPVLQEVPKLERPGGHDDTQLMVHTEAATDLSDALHRLLSGLQ